MKRVFLFLFFLPFTIFFSFTQEVFNNETRALYILDISKYVEWPAEIMLPATEFRIGVLSSDDDLYWELENMAKTRKYVQGKPIRVYLYRNVDDLENTMVLYVNEKENIPVGRIYNKIEGQSTLLITEGYPFRESMINFVVIDEKPRFEVNEEKMNAENLEVNELFLSLAVKTREDWEALFKVTDEELTEEKEITKQQRELIEEQKREIEEQKKQIAIQLARLDSLDRAIQLKQNEIEQKQSTLTRQEAEIEDKKRIIEDQLAQSAKQREILEVQLQKIEESEALIDKQLQKISQQDEQIVLQVEQIEKQKIITYAMIIALVLMLGIIYFVYINYRNKKRANIALQEKNTQITSQKEEIRKQRDIAESQRDQIAYQKKHITDSIEYAKRIQTAILPSLELFSDKIKHFVLYKPRDIVSGDFYWVNEIDKKQIIIAADCTGHGVPGAFMSMLGISLLNEIVTAKKILEPDQILDELRQQIILSLQQKGTNHVKDGMDMTVCNLDIDSGKLKFAGANNPLYLVRDSELKVYKPDRMPVSVHDRMEPFTINEINLQKNDRIYMFSDGYVDQFGGPKQKKFLSKNFKNLILETKNMSMYEQGAKLNEVFEEWRKDIEQVDDVVVIGIEV